MTRALVVHCHPIEESFVAAVRDRTLAGLAAAGAEVRCTGQTGVEMEALTAASVAGLTIYDMLKAAEKGMQIGDIHLVEKTGGRSGHYRAAAKAAAARQD